MANNPCKDCVFFKPHNDRILNRMVVNAQADLDKLDEDIKAYNTQPWWKFWKLHPDRNGHVRYYYESFLEKLSEKRKGSCTLNPVHVRVDEDHGCGQFKPKA